MANEVNETNRGNLDRQTDKGTQNIPWGGKHCTVNCRESNECCQETLYPAIFPLWTKKQTELHCIYPPPLLEGFNQTHFQIIVCSFQFAFLQYLLVNQWLLSGKTWSDRNFENAFFLSTFWANNLELVSPLKILKDFGRCQKQQKSSRGLRNEGSWYRGRGWKPSVLKIPPFPDSQIVLIIKQL